MQEGTVVRWLKAEGSQVEMGEAIAEIETDKAVVEFESYASGILHKILVSEGTTVPVGQIIAIVGEPGEQVPDVETATAKQPETKISEEAIPPMAEPDTQAAAPVKESIPAPVATVRASPVARRLADENGVDLAAITGTGPGGRITKDDVLSYVESSRQAVAAPEAGVAGAAEAAPATPAPVAESVSEALGSMTDEAQPAAAPATPAPVAESVSEALGATIDEAQPAAAAIELPAAQAAPTPPPQAATPPPTPTTVEAVPAPEPEVAVTSSAPGTAELRPATQGEKIPLSRMRQQVARVTIRSKQEKPHFYVSSEIDMTEAMALRRQINAAMEAEDVHTTVNDMIITACVQTLGKYPTFNAYYVDDGVQMNDGINVGVAIAVEDGLIMPAILDCGGKSLKQIAIASKDLAERAQRGTLHPDEYTGGTFAISNLGMFDVTSFIAIIQPPQTAVLAVGTVSKRPVVRDDEVVVREVMNATLSADHRIVDGAQGAQFLVEVKRLLETPMNLLL
ncbi:MAG: 2-oxo acid dehydrogenase subunit E2 [Chloroflexi bacterium]|nr:2-oxo acid dehydrogenase subunit E2 [Chloroflexota bacterium]